MKSLALLTALFTGFLASSAQASDVVVLEVDGPIGVTTSEYILNGIEHAEESGAKLVILEMDTPGGLVSSTRDIIQGILGSSVPVATYVAPDGARADSAGTYILLASHIAAMAPTTHIGAATPVSLGGDDATPPMPVEPPADPEQTDEEAEESEPAGNGAGTALERKVLNDAIAYIRGLAERHGRNADWAELAVTEAATLTADEALEENVIEVIAETRSDLIEQVDGREVVMDTGTAVLELANVTITEYEPNWRIKILSAIANPEIALLLGLVGFYGLIYEFLNPGAIFPGVAGVICLLLAGYALQVLPVNYAGLALIIVGLALMTAEAFAPSFGFLGLGGIVAFVFGAIMMFDTGIPGFGISIAFVASVAIVAALFLFWLVTFVLKLRRRGAVSGAESIVGGIGKAMFDFTGDGKIWLQGESWAARSTIPLEKDQEVVVTNMVGLTLEVEPRNH
ncbi:MAG: nodulation protein NfeD [Woeseiaceae bacterium]|nr:nodulation protein NfeD [Woeseiaceae bacterium]